jgi:hypothetical protein
LKQKNPLWRKVEVRVNGYLNNVVEQDHRAIKRRCAAMLGLKSYRTAAITLAGIELVHRVRKRQFALRARDAHRFASLKELWTCALRPYQAGIEASGVTFSSVTPKRTRTHVL